MDSSVARTAWLVVATFVCVTAAGPSHAQQTVECRSHNNRYTECQAPLQSPQLIHQISSASCIINRTWGFNPTTHRLWVAEGCAGVFADPQGYHYGRNDRYDQGARHYDSRGHDTGAVAAGLIAAVLIGAAMHDDDAKSREYTTSNDYYSHPAHTRHARSDSQDIDTRPSFDKEGNPNFDTTGGYIGCHGIGCEVDNPDTPGN